jgi:C4-dicarboxylate-specific signal transduction histidine kinase
MQQESADMQLPRTADHFWEFAALTHEIRQPLTAILSNAQAAWHFLAMDTPDVQEARAALADIIAGARRTNEVIRQLQAFLTAGKLARTCLHMNDVIYETIELVRSDADAQQVLITLDLAADLPVVSGDRIQLRQVLLNLVRNAFEAMHQVEDGSRTLVVRSISTPPGGLTVAVQDCGPSIDKTSLARLFHPFFTTKAGGMGLGLTLSRSIIAAHGGWIWATRNPDRGLTVSFTLAAVAPGRSATRHKLSQG